MIPCHPATKGRRAIYGTDEHSGTAATIPGTGAERPVGTLLTRLQTMLSPTAAANLERITARTGQTKRQAIETALNELARSLQCNE